MSVKKRYNFFIYATLAIAIVLIIVGITQSNPNAANAITQDEVITKTNNSNDPLPKLNKYFIIHSYVTEYTEDKLQDSNLKQILPTGLSHIDVDRDSITYVNTKKDVEKNVNIFQYKATLTISTESVGNEPESKELIFNIEFDEDDESYVVVDTELP